MRISVTKMHGARNDFVILDRRKKRSANLALFARWACDRRAGIGADGLIVLESSALADARMRIVNADGSEAEMCGNGIRCAARWLDETGERGSLTFETDAGLVATEILGRGREYAVRVSMGTPHIEEIFLASLGSGWFVDLGNPHVVFFRPNVDELDLEIAAERLQRDATFPNGTNVHVAAVQDEDSIRVRHWERGVGLTMACGTGAVACATVAIRSGIGGSPVEVLVPGGRLAVEWDGAGDAHLTGPAVRVFDTEVDAADDLAS
ncbi:MAG TPA: diaminopimelate epimerase [Candidatus Cybelea sp.]|jgi:diaminopimelate epimerase|nr:diaminopimelate epimerase [Candidatus Cybelea sp.]